MQLLCCENSGVREGKYVLVCVCVSPLYCIHAYIISGFSLQIHYDLDILCTFASELSQKLVQVSSKLEEIEM